MGSSVPARGYGAGWGHPDHAGEKPQDDTGPASPGAKFSEVSRSPVQSAPDSFFQPRANRCPHPGILPTDIELDLGPEGTYAALPTDPCVSSLQRGSTGATSPSVRSASPHLSRCLWPLRSSSAFLVKQRKLIKHSAASSTLPLTSEVAGISENL